MYIDQNQILKSVSQIKQRYISSKYKDTNKKNIKIKRPFTKTMSIAAAIL